MKTIITLLLTIPAFAFARAETPPAPAPPQPLTVAVLDFQVSDKDLGNKGSEAAVLLGAKLSASPNVILVERQELDKILGEQELGLTGTVTPETAAKVGYLTGAKVLITGRVFNAGDKFYIVAKIISTETGRVYGETATFDDPKGLETAVQELTPKITDTLDKHGDTLIAKVEDPAERLDRLKKIVAGKKLPSVSVQIAEQHINRVVIDPAAQTEMKLMLQQLGFEVIEPNNAAKRADITITGEAFSELGGRKGNLISCRARVEIKVSQITPDKLLLADRQTDVAVDIAEKHRGQDRAAKRRAETARPHCAEIGGIRSHRKRDKPLQCALERLRCCLPSRVSARGPIRAPRPPRLPWR